MNNSDEAILRTLAAAVGIMLIWRLPKMWEFVIMGAILWWIFI